MRRYKDQGVRREEHSEHDRRREGTEESSDERERAKEE
jgi:hypothetical protein